MIGTIVNTAAIVTGSVLGSLLKKGIKDKYKDALYTAMGLAATAIGINSVANNMPKSKYQVLFIVSLALGSLIGSMIDIDGAFHKLTDRIKIGSSDLGRGLSTGILLFCVGTLSILGPIESAVNGNNMLLFTNATLDLVTSTVLASTYGIGIALAGGVLFLWQGSLYLLGSLLGSFIPTELMTEISVVGGILIASSGISILNIKNIKTMNMLPSLLIPPVFFGIMAIFGLV